MAELTSDELRVSLTALRDLLAGAIVHAEPREMAPLARQLREVLERLDRLAPPKEKSTVDELLERRARRASVSDVADSGGGVGG